MMMNGPQFWDRLMPTLMMVPDDQRALAVGHVLESVRGIDHADDAMIQRLVEELQVRFGVAGPARH
jgi:hypothetical protein